MTFNTKLINLLKTDPRFVDDDGELVPAAVQDRAWKIDRDLVKLLLSDKDIKAKFFEEIEGHWIFNLNAFIDYISQKNFLDNSYTRFRNRIGLTIGGKFLRERGEVALVWPYKDCYLEGGQTKEEEKRKEIFFNEVLAQDEINRLLDPKVLTNFRRYTARPVIARERSDRSNLPPNEETASPSARSDMEVVEEKVTGFRRDENGVIRENLIIKGNNLLALHTLKTQFRGKVKLIYIDPPYNTGNDSFGYNDRFNHSTWLTFMKNRLEVARELLRDDGVIFVQCDDNEQAYLKVLMDEVFGRENFINTVSAKMKNIAGASGGGEDKRLKKNIEFINIFAKRYNNSKLEKAYEYTEISKLVEYYRTENISWKYTSVVIDYGEKEYLKSTKDGDGNEIKIYLMKNPVFKSVSQISKEENLSEKEVYYKYIDRIFTTAMPQSSIRTRVLKAIKDDEFDFVSIEYVPRTGKNKGVIYEQFYKGDKLRLLTWLKDVIEIKDGVIYKKDLQGTFWDGFNLNNLSKEGDTVFRSGKKPEELVKKVLDIATHPKDIVLDYHLGSGTTAAVAHKMGRQYIGIEQMDYIETIPVERLKKVIKGEQGGISESVGWQGGGDFIYCELMKYNQAFMERIQAAKTSAELVQIWREMAENSFLNWYVNPSMPEEAVKDFEALGAPPRPSPNSQNFGRVSEEREGLEKQKHLLAELLDKNQLYVHLSEIDDTQFRVSEADKALNRKFYGEQP